MVGEGIITTSLNSTRSEMNTQNTKNGSCFSVLDKKTEFLDFVFLKNGQSIQKTRFKEPTPQRTRPKYGGYTKPINLSDQRPQYFGWKKCNF